MAEKFKPIPPQDLTGDLKAKVQEIDENWQNHPVKRNFHGRWKEYIAWFEGNQYTYYSEKTGKLIDISDQVDREVKNVYNRILPMIRQMWGTIIYPHSFYVEPNTTESSDVKAAKLGSALLEYTNTSSYGKYNRKLNFSKLWALITGQCFWKEWWNRELFGYIQNKNRELVKEKGGLDFNYINPFNVRPDPLAKSREGWRFFDEGKRVSKYSVEQEFGLKPGSLPAEKKEGADTGLFERADYERPSEDTIIRIERWERPSPGRSKGRFIVTAGGWFLWDSENPAPEADIPHFMIPGIIPILNEQWYDSAVRIGQGSQRQLNRYGSMIDEHIQNYKLKALIFPGSLRPGEYEKYTRAGVDYVQVTPGTQAPYWQQPPALNEIIIRWLNFMESEFEIETSVRKTSYGLIPRYTQRPSNVLFESMKHQDEVPLIPTADDINTSLEDVMRFRLQLAQKHYSPARLTKITGKNNRVSSLFIRGTELKDNTDVRVRGGVELFSEKQAKREVVDTLVQKGYIEDARKALQLLGLDKGLEEFYEEEFIDENQAMRENELLREGRITPHAHRDDNHEVHLVIHDNERKKEEWDSWDAEAKARLEKMKSEHREFIQPSPEETVAPAGEEVVTETAGTAAAPVMGVTPNTGVAPAPAVSPEELRKFLDDLAAIIALQGGGY